MEKIRSEVSDKIRSAIKAKLLEIGAYVDEELPEYIMVMVANKRSKAQMDADLSLFLGSHTEKFTEWLHVVLQKLQKIIVPIPVAVQSASSEQEKPKALPEGEEEVEKSPLKPKPKTDKDKKEWKREKTNTVPPTTSPKYLPTAPADALDAPTSKMEVAKPPEYVPSAIIRKNAAANNEQDNEEVEEDYLMIRYDVDNDSPPEEDEVVKYRNPEPPSPVRPSPVERPPTVRSNVSTTSGSSKRRVICLNEDEEFHQPVKKSRNSGAERVSVKSRIGSVRTAKKEGDSNRRNSQKPLRFVEEEDGEADEDQGMARIASVINVTARPRVHASGQANKSLVLKAVAEAEKSIVARKVSRENTIEQEKKEKPMVDLYTRKYREKHGMVEPNKIAVAFPTRRAVVQDEPEEKRAASSSPVEIEAEKEPAQEVVRKPTKIASSPTFIVTLEKKPKDVDEAMECEEEEFVEEEIISEEEDEEPQGTVVDGIINERCKFWPACRLGDQCLYKHPTKLCKKFPACVFGEKCVYIHPNCRYDGACSRQQCPFTHATPRNRGFVPALKVLQLHKNIASVPNFGVVCKYFPRCSNASCQFIHPTPCKFGPACARPGCTFTHPPAPKPVKAPPKKLMKWVAPGLKQASL